MTIASKRSPQRQGLRVTSNVHRSTIRRATPYCAAARMMPGCFSVASQPFCRLIECKLTHLCHAFVVRQCQNRIQGRQSRQ